MKKHDLKQLGVPNASLDLAVEYITAAAHGGLLRRYKPSELIEMILANPQSYFNDSIAGRFAKSIAADAKLVNADRVIPLKIWGEENIDLNAIDQMRTACRLPVAMKAALMGDGHLGYGLAIGGVLGTINSVVPYGIGVDIGCKMHMSVFDLPADDFEKHRDRLRKAIVDETQFGIGCEWEQKRQHAVMDRDWSITDLTKRLKDKAASQLGTSGSGNHFITTGTIEFRQAHEDIENGKKYIAVITHSGSRRPGAEVCSYYSKIAIKQLPKQYNWAKNLAWLDLDSEEGQEYWLAMNLMCDYAKANHECIHRHVSQHLGVRSILTVENHHNYAVKEIHDGVEMVVHRKGATPAGLGRVGVIPGTMADPSYLVKGLGNPESLASASHGAGRKYGRSAAKQAFNWKFWNAELKRRGVELLSAGLDEMPGAYKNIQKVMASQADLVEIVAEFTPRIVKMAGEGPAED